MMLRESGISDEMEKIGINPTRIGPDVGQTQTMSDYNFEPLIVSQMKGIFYLFMIVNSLSLLSFLIECIQNGKNFKSPSMPRDLLNSRRNFNRKESQIVQVSNLNHRRSILNGIIIKIVSLHLEIFNNKYCLKTMCAYHRKLKCNWLNL